MWRSLKTGDSTCTATKSCRRFFLVAHWVEINRDQLNELRTDARVDCQYEKAPRREPPGGEAAFQKSEWGTKGGRKSSGTKKPRKTGLFHNNVAVKERFESTRTLNPSAEAPEYKGSSGASCAKVFPRHSHEHQHASLYACASHV